MISSNSWHLLLGDEVLRLLETDMYRGLSADEAKKRRRRLRGQVWHVRRTSAWEAAAASLFDLPTLLLVVAAAAAAVFDRRFEAGAIAAVLAVGALVRTVVSVRANRILEDMARSRIPVGSVIRDGRVHLLSAHEIVPGDIIFLDAGDTVPCDGRVITGDDSVVSERGITANEVPVHKFATVIATEADSGEVPCEFRSNMLFAGSLVLAGSVRIAATACGDDTLVSMKQGGITIDAERDFPLVERLKKQSRIVSLVMLAAVMVLTGLAMLRGAGMALPDVFLGTMAMAVASMSEFFSSIAAVIMAVSVRRAAGSKNGNGEGECRVLFRDPSRMEDAASTRAMVFCGSGFFKSGRAELLAYRLGTVYTGPDEKGGDPGELLALALAAAQPVRRTGLSGGKKRESVSHRASERANIASLAADALTKQTGRSLPPAYAVGDHRDSSDRLAAGLEISLCERDGVVWAVGCGSVRDVLACCGSVENAGGDVPLTPGEAEAILREAADLEARGARVLAVAKRVSPYPHLNRLAVLTQAMTFAGFFAVSMEAERDAKSNVDYLKRTGIRPILFTETPDADLYYGRRLGLFDEDTVPVPAGEWDAPAAGRVLADRDNADRGVLVAFDSIGDAYLGSAYAEAMTSLAAVRMGTGSESRRRRKREDDGDASVVAAMGMEAWDAGVLGRADVGFAVAGSRLRAVPESIARGAAVVIHPETGGTEPGFGGLAGAVKAVRCARCAVANVERARFYLTAARAARLILMLAAVLGIVPLPSAVFILIWGLLFDFGAVLVRAFGRDEEAEESEPDVRDEQSALLAALISGAVWGAVLILGTWLSGRLLPAVPAFSSFGADSGTLRAFLSGAALLSGQAMAAESGRRGSLFSRRRIHAAGALFHILSLIFACWTLFTESGAVLSGGLPCGIAGLLAFVPALATFAAAELLKLIRKKS